jgi:hypothetical protein
MFKFLQYFWKFAATGIKSELIRSRLGSLLYMLYCIVSFRCRVPLLKFNSMGMYIKGTVAPV